MFRHIQELSLSFYERYTSGRVIARLTSDIDALQELLATGLASLITSVISIVGGERFVGEKHLVRIEEDKRGA